jgi:hypothetical protein
MTAENEGWVDSSDDLLAESPADAFLFGPMLSDPSSATFGFSLAGLPNRSLSAESQPSVATGQALGSSELLLLTPLNRATLPLVPLCLGQPAAGDGAILPFAGAWRSDGAPLESRCDDTVLPWVLGVPALMSEATLPETSREGKEANGSASRWSNPAIADAVFQGWSAPTDPGEGSEAGGEGAGDAGGE